MKKDYVVCYKRHDDENPVGKIAEMNGCTIEEIKDLFEDYKIISIRSKSEIEVCADGKERSFQLNGVTGTIHYTNVKDGKEFGRVFFISKGKNAPKWATDNVKAMMEHAKTI